MAKPEGEKVLEPTDQGLADPRLSSILVIGVGVVVIAGLAVFGFAFDQMSDDLRAENEQLRREVQQLGGRRLDPPAPEPAPAPAPAAVEADDLRSARATAFGPEVRSGRVSAVEGELDPGPAVGDRCVVEVWPVMDGSPTANCRVEVYCGALELYGPTVGRPEGDGWAWNLCGVRDGRPTSAYDGQPTGPEGDPQLELRLPEHRVIVSDDEPRMRVEVRLDPADTSGEGAPPALFHPLDFEPEVRFGSVARAEGYGGISRGDACSVELWPVVPPSNARAPLNGRAFVRCGATPLFGPEVGSDGNDWGWLRVGVRDGHATRAYDTEPTGDYGDPELHLDLPSRNAVVADGPGRRVEIRLDR